MRTTIFSSGILAFLWMWKGMSLGAAEELDVSGDEWRIAQAEYRQFYSSLPPIIYERVLVSPETEPTISRSGQEFSKRREATIWDDGSRCAISDICIYTDFQIAYWIGHDGESYGAWTQDQHLTGVGIKPATANIKPPGPVDGSICSEWTLHRLLGRNLHCRKGSLFDVFDQKPQSLTKATLDGKQCLKCRFEGIELSPSLPGVTYVLTAWLDSDLNSFPRKIRAEATNGEFTDIHILETTQVTDPNGMTWNLPHVARGQTDHYAIDITFSSIKAVDSISIEQFRLPMPFATQVLDQSKGIDELYYVGGAEGQRECMRLAQIAPTLIKAIVDSDPQAMRELQSKIPNGSALNAKTPGQGLESTHWSWTTWLWIMSGFIVMAAVVVKYRSPAN